ncbi:selenocysteine-specific translation elongation factor [Oceanisphaera profunda]|uniref:Selenocysteine-specific translation elongation factor n=1 Tax=Oceanisphaera profunda TaxID=1416627 RepID=A0A1Y0D4Q2_9GAMM|nr:selenocysteine-specific translation elongation factor [Oceanisphaera profunda]ART82085.1 selenocysteine-specific translation elongation factor [Oceanisphaera profunda]
MIIGTAGHIDHGKTALVRALTGVNTDRLKDEQERGITISLGYAYQQLEQNITLGFVDVPGHEGLIHTMVAGATGIDYAMLVVAADDGIMPQTLEHIAILSLLGLTQGCVVITKQDKAQPEQLAQTQAQLSQALANTFLNTAPRFLVDSLSGGGIPALRDFLQQQAQQQKFANRSGLFRLAIDRAFTLSGQGTVVTGTVHGGAFNLQSSDIKLRLMPANTPIRVRSIHAQNLPSTNAYAGQRCALNIANMPKEAIERGDWLADERCFTPSIRIDVQLQLLNNLTQPIITWMPVHVHMGAAHVMAHVVPLSKETLQAGEQAYAQLVFDSPQCAMPGDRFIIRNAQAKQTLGGGWVLDANGPDRKRRTPARLSWLASIANYLTDQQLLLLLSQAPYGIPYPDLQRLIHGDVEQLVIPDSALWVTPTTNKQSAVMMDKSQWETLLSHIEDTLKLAHQRYPDEPGIGADRLRRMTAPAMPISLWQSALQTLVQAQRLNLQGAWYHLPEHTVSFSEQEQQLAEQILLLSHQGQYDPPWVRELASLLDIPEQEIRQLGRKLVQQGKLYQVQPDLLYHHQHIEQLAQLMRQRPKDQGIKAAELRDQLALGRKRTLQILEFFQRIGYSRRLHDRHVIRPDNLLFTS